MLIPNVGKSIVILAFSAGFSCFGRPNLAYGYTFLARQEPKKSRVGKKDFAFFLRLGCDLLIVS